MGRREQLALLDDAAVEVLQGEPRFVVVGGAAGVGKTRLIEHFAANCDGAGWLVVRGACVRLGSEGAPVAAITSVLRDLVRQLGVDRVAELVPGSADVLRLLPELGFPDNGSDGQGRRFDVLAALLRRLSAEQPVLLVIDDLHWADWTGRELLTFLARTLRDGPVLAVTAYRSEDVDREHPLRSVLAELDRLPRVERLELGPFTRAETADLIANVLGGRAPALLVDRVFRRSRGNPLFAEELARAAPAGEDRLPESLRDLLLDRVRRLDESARQVVHTAAVGDPSISYGLLAATAGLPEDALLAGLRGAVDTRVLTVDTDPDSYRFRHALLREAVVEDMLPAERVRLHRACAEALEARSSLVSADRQAAEIALHWYCANEPRRALPALLRAADAAEARHDHAEQSRLLRHALEVWPRAAKAGQPTDADRLDVWESAIFATLCAGDPLDALSLVQRALAETAPTAEAEPVAMLHARRSQALEHAGRGDEAVTAVDDALAVVPTGRTAGRARVLDVAAAVLMVRGHLRRARALSTEAIDVADEVGDERVATNAQVTLGTSLAEVGEYDEGLDTLHTARKRAEARGDATCLARMQANASHVLGLVGRHDEAADAARAGLGHARAAGFSRSHATLNINLADALLATGHWDEAESVCAEALTTDPPGPFGARLHTVRAEIALARGDLDNAREQHSLASALLGDTTCSIAQVPVRRLHAEIALYSNVLDDAQQAIHHTIRVASDLENVRSTTDAWRLLATGARIAAHAQARARLVGAQHDNLAETVCATAAALPVNTPLLAAYAAHVGAELDTPAGWPDVIDAWDNIGDPYAGAYARLRAAETEVSSGDDRIASWLRTASDMARRLEAEPLLRDIMLSAKGAGITLAPEPEPLTSVSDFDRLGLTRRETEVLRLVVAGHTNRQIAERLFISPKTASSHVSHILDKLDVTNRGEAAATAYRLRLFDDEQAS